MVKYVLLSARRATYTSYVSCIKGAMLWIAPQRSSQETWDMLWPKTCVSECATECRGPQCVKSNQQLSLTCHCSSRDSFTVDNPAREGVPEPTTLTATAARLKSNYFLFPYRWDKCPFPLKPNRSEGIFNEGLEVGVLANQNSFHLSLRSYLQILPI